MQKKLRIERVALVLGLAVLLLTLIMNVWPLLFMHPLDTGRIPGTDIYSLRGGNSNLFLTQTEEGWLAIDAGASVKDIEGALEQMGLNAASITNLLLTHSDSDHVAAISIFQDAQIYLSASELPMVDGTLKRNMFSRNSLPRSLEEIGPQLLYNGQQLEIGGHQISCLALAGHTPGSMGYLLDGKYLFSGDALKVSGNKLKLHPYTMDKQKGRESLQIIRDLDMPDLLILTAHYGYYQLKDLR